MVMSPSPGPQLARPVRGGAHRQSAAARRAGFLVGSVINAVLLFLVNVRPGWEAVPFLTADTTLVLGLVNATLLVALLSGLLCSAAVDAPRVRALTDLAQNAVGLAALVRIWQVFPFDFEGDGLDWALVVRWVLGLGMFGSVIGMVSALVRLVMRRDRAR